MLLKHAKEERKRERERELREWKKKGVGSTEAPQGVRRIDA